ncbi:LCP family protein [Actinacidiphila paucisporea]|uniref:Transcriptional attenuator, LytR family n=1 Tax=Actinacidiphila paucisporea TaxID=310782 RepID=A0A1M7F9V0_9ACTN|nr:LCP family protein [Actinacidiphila paucisporea]SHM00796.1 transcriptional attenuator, LytR family [Actinacidiphila paucisporea]
MDAEESGYVDPADQWVLDPVTGLYELRLDAPSEPVSAPAPAPAEPVPPRRARSAAVRAPAGRAGRGGRRAAPAAGSRRRKARSRRPPALVWAVGAACAVLVAGVIAGIAALGRGDGPSIHTVDIGAAGSKDPVHTGAMNVLVLSRKPADTAVLLHLAADRGNATALGIPPALVTDIPDCRVGGGTVKGAKQQPFSAALAGRGPGCALRVAEQATGLPVDHVVLVDYAAARAASTGIAAADLCVDRTLADPRNLTALARTAPAALTTDAPLGSVKALGALAGAMGAADPEHLTFATVPVADRAKASQLYALLAHDVNLSPDHPAAADPKLVGPKATPHNTRVEVYNGTGVFGASQDVLTWLQNSQGVNRSTNGGDAHGRAPRTTLQYAPNQADQARSLAAMMGLPASALVPGTKDAAPRANMTLTLGADFTAPGVPVGPPTAPPKGVALTPASAVHC